MTCSSPGDAAESIGPGPGGGWCFDSLITPATSFCLLLTKHGLLYLFWPLRLLVLFLLPTFLSLHYFQRYNYLHFLRLIRIGLLFPCFLFVLLLPLTSHPSFCSFRGFLLLSLLLYSCCPFLPLSYTVSFLHLQHIPFILSLCYTVCLLVSSVHYAVILSSVFSHSSVSFHHFLSSFLQSMFSFNRSSLHHPPCHVMLIVNSLHRSTNIGSRGTILADCGTKLTAGIGIRYFSVSHTAINTETQKHDECQSHRASPADPKVSKSRRMK